MYGVSALLVLVNTALAWALVERRWRAAGAAGLLSVAAVGGAALVGRAQLGSSPDGPTLPVALVQGNIAQAVKWDAAFRAETFRIYGQLTRAAAPGSRLDRVAGGGGARVPPLRARRDALADRAGGRGAGAAPRGRARRGGEGRRVRYLNSAFLVEAAGVRASL